MTGWLPGPQRLADIKMLEGLRDQLPREHADRRGVVRSIEVLATDPRADTGVLDPPPVNPVDVMTDDERKALRQAIDIALKQYRQLAHDVKLMEGVVAYAMEQEDLLNAVQKRLGI